MQKSNKSTEKRFYKTLKQQLLIEVLMRVPLAQQKQGIVL